MTIPPSLAPRLLPHRILLIRLDRIGDVVLSTPIIQQLREAYPEAHIAMMVRPVARDLVEGNPYLNEVIVYEKEGKHKSPSQTIKFALDLSLRKFDTVLVLHPSNRSHWIAFLARIPNRIGWNHKCGWLLTHRVAHRKQEGDQSEAEYTLELLKPLGLTPSTPIAHVPVSDSAVRHVERIFEELSILETDTLVAIHPSASCISKRWMADRFAQVADRLILQRGIRICLIAGPDDKLHADAVSSAMKQPAVNFAGILNIAELSALLNKCRLLISNDSGPVHIAAGVGTPVVDIFGRNQKGLSPKRWGPLGDKHEILHKEVGCETCLAHNCNIDFLCLTELTVDEVYQAAEKVLSGKD